MKRIRRLFTWLMIVVMIAGISGVSTIEAEAADAIIVNAHSGEGAGSITFTLSADSGGSIDLKYVAYGGNNSGSTEGTADADRHTGPTARFTYTEMK